MALAFGVEFDPEELAPPRFTHVLAPWTRRGATASPWIRSASFARNWLKRSSRAQARCAVDASPDAIRRENATIADTFARLADIVSITEDERYVLLAAARDPCRVILALETIGAALYLCGAPEATLDWLRTEISQAPFNGRAPLTLFAADGQFGVEIALFYLRARLREATRLAPAAA